MSDFINISLRENRFWLRIMEEHVLFMRLGFPCDETSLINKARKFERAFGFLRADADNLREVTRAEVQRINARSQGGKANAIQKRA